MKRRWMLRAVAAASALLMLSGCVPSDGVPAGPTDADARAEAEQILADEFDRLKASVPEELPRLPEFEFVAQDDLPQVLDDCIEGGPGERYFNYVGSPPAPFETEEATYIDARVADFYCRARYQADPRENYLMNDEQKDFLYDYFVNWLIPCLELRGRHVTEIPERAYFVSQFWGWTPYRSYFDEPSVDVEMLRSFNVQCPVYPDALPISERDYFGFGS